MKTQYILILMLLVGCSQFGHSETFEQNVNWNWFVYTDGNDLDDGHSWTTAKKTINSALSESNNGDTIIIAPGDYNEALNFMTKWGITLIGAQNNKRSRIITNYQGSIIKCGHNTTIKNLYIENTRPLNETPNTAIQSTNRNNITLENCYIKSGATPIVLSDCPDSVIKNCIVYGAEYGIALWGTGTNKTIIKDCHITVEDWTVCSTAGIFAYGSHVSVDNCIIQSSKPNADETFQSRCIQVIENGSVAANNCIFIYGSSNYNYQYGVDILGDGYMALLNCVFVLKSTGDNCFSIVNYDGDLTVSNCIYTNTN
ncbi:MAG: hypothetical protein WDA68_01810 [Phycisphaerae bacterium]